MVLNLKFIIHYTPMMTLHLFRMLHFSAESSIETCDVKSLPPDTLKVIEADSFWCFSKLLDGIQDNYTFAQPGIQLKVNALKDIVSRVDSE